jgi:hypothetical protein
VDLTHNAFASHPLQTGSVRPDGSCSADKGGPDPQALSGSLCFPSRPGSQPVPHPIYFRASSSRFRFASYSCFATWSSFSFSAVAHVGGPLSPGHFMPV